MKKNNIPTVMLKIAGEFTTFTVFKDKIKELVVSKAAK